MKNFMICLTLCLGCLAFAPTAGAQAKLALEPIDVSKGIDLNACQAKAKQLPACSKATEAQKTADLDCCEEAEMAQVQCATQKTPNCCMPPLCCKKGASVGHAATTDRDQAPTVQASEERQPACKEKPKTSKAL